MIIHLRDCPAQPWKNGLGRTRELAVQPSIHGSFAWRVSIAEVDSAALFSSFPGIDRSIVLLAGDGFHMTLDGQRRHALTEPFKPFAFAGEAAVAVTLAGGATRDFNLMVRRAEAAGEIDVWRPSGHRAAGRSLVLVYCAGGEISSPDGTLRAGDAWRATGSTSGEFFVHENAIALAVRVVPRDVMADHDGRQLPGYGAGSDDMQRI